MGRRKKSETEQTLKGNPGKRKRTPPKRKTTAKAKGTPAAKPKTTRTKAAATKTPTTTDLVAESSTPPPEWLGEKAKEKWRDVFPLFDRRGVVTELDLDALSIYCDAWQQLHEADAIVKQGAYFETEKGYVGVHPACQRRAQAIATIRKMGEQLGLTPNSRRGLDVEPPETNRLTEFLK